MILFTNCIFALLILEGKDKPNYWCWRMIMKLARKLSRRGEILTVFRRFGLLDSLKMALVGTAGAIKGAMDLMIHVLY